MTKSTTKRKVIRHTDIAGKDFLYHGNQYHITKAEKDGMRIITDKRIFNFYSEKERDYFLAELLPTESLPTAADPALSRNRGYGAILKADKNSDDIFIRMLGELEEDFETMKQNPEYVKVAKQRANHVNTMTNLVKTKIALEKLNRS